MLHRIIAIFMFLGLLNFNVSAQENYKLIKEGTKLLEQKKYGEAEAAFRKVIKNNDTIKEAYYNLGNAVYAQKRYAEARESYTKALPFFKDKMEIAETHHNIGNTFMGEKKWEESIKSFKNALRNNPTDMDTKYNLAYAQEMLKKQQQDQQKNQPDDKKDQDKKDDKKDDKKEDNKDGDKDKKDQEQKEKDKKESDKKDSEKDPEKKGDNKDENAKPKDGEGQPNKLSKEQTDRLLNAIEAQEQKLQDKKKQEEMTPVRIGTDKDW